MRKLNSYENSRAQFARAAKVIPSGIYGHQGPAEGCYIPVEAFPLFSDHAQGTYFWDVDGNRFIDYMCAYGPNILGYNDPDVDEAARRQAEKENCVTAPSTVMIDFAELLVDTVACADWAFFAKNGNDVTTGAILCARAYTHRKKIVFFKGYYHGVAPWTQKVDYPGVLEEDVMHNLYVDWNDFDQLAETFERYKGQIAAVIAQPYMHGNFMDNQLPLPGYWQKVRKLCTDNDVVLIVDDVRAGFRMDLAGSDHYFGFEADLICFCKALANGYNVVSVDSQAKALMEVQAGTADAAIIDSLMAGAMVGEGTSYPNLTITDQKLTEELYGVGCRKGSDLASFINSVMAGAYADGVLEATAETYGVQAALVEQPASEFTASESDSDVQYIKDKGTLVIGITEFEPMDYQDADGNWIGFDADMAKLVAEKLGVEPVFTVINWDNKVFELNGKGIDVVWNGMTITTAAQESMECTNAYCNNAQVIVTK